MLRVILGIGGVALIALGVFGGSVLQDTQQAINGFFEPETVIAEAPAPSPSPQAAQPVEAVETVIAAVNPPTADPLVVKTDADPAGGVTEVKASAKDQSALIKTAAVAVEPAVSEQPAILPKQAEVEQIVKTTAGSATDNTLFVLKERVNLREGPSIDHPIVLQLDIGQELMEFKRDGKWVHVGAYGTSGKIGWVHGTLVGKN
ncbi:MAG: SH3 domain-containing protein [Pseudomonadota bacterium]